MQKVLEFLRYYPLYWGIFLTLIPVIILLSRRRRLSVSFRFLLVYLSGKFIVDFLMLYYAGAGENTIWLHNYTLPLRYILVSQVFRYFIDSEKIRRWVLMSWPFFLLLSAADIYYSNIRSESLADHLSVRYGGIIECILMLLWILLYLYEVFKSLKIANLLKSPSFVTAVAWLIFYSSLVFFAPVFYYIHRGGESINLGALTFIPDAMEFLSIVVLTYAVSLIPYRRA